MLLKFKPLHTHAEMLSAGTLYGCLQKVMLQVDRGMMGINERRIIQEIKTVANLEHRDNPYDSGWGLVLEYCRQLLEGENNEQPGIH